tara:strand:+ start:308 stop:667 length:360 start_codon:yes stop_codon:yes gene_type:complete
MSNDYITVTGDVAMSTLVTANKVAKWCVKRFNLEGITINISIERDVDCWGECGVGTEGNQYDIMVCSNQPLRDFVATIVHEMIHVAQWEKNEWYETDGEKECEDLQYKLTDELWRKNIL